MGKAIFKGWWKVVFDDNNDSNITSTMFSFIPLRIKMVFIAITIFIFFLVIFIVAFTEGITEIDDDVSNEIIDSDKLSRYENSIFPMPFEQWIDGVDIKTSSFSKSRTITVNGVTQTKAHTGIDLVVVSKEEPKICSVLEGKVVVAKARNTGYGNYVVIEHILENNQYIYTLYGHMKNGSLMVKEGDMVQTGEVLGIMGTTGNSTGEHLHFEIRINENSSTNAINPYKYLFGKEE